MHTHTWLCPILYCLLMVHLVILPIFYHPNGKSRQMILFLKQAAHLLVCGFHNFFANCEFFLARNFSRFYVSMMRKLTRILNYLFQQNDAEHSTQMTVSNVGDRKRKWNKYSTISQRSQIISCSFTAQHYILHLEQR